MGIEEHGAEEGQNLEDLQSFWFQAKTQPSTLASEASSQNTRTVLTFSTHSSLLVQRVLSQTTVVVAPLKSSQALQNSLPSQASFKAATLQPSAFSPPRAGSFSSPLPEKPPQVPLRRTVMEPGKQARWPNAAPHFWSESPSTWTALPQLPVAGRFASRPRHGPSPIEHDFGGIAPSRIEFENSGSQTS